MSIIYTCAKYLYMHSKSASPSMIFAIWGWTLQIVLRVSECSWKAQFRDSWLLSTCLKKFFFSDFSLYIPGYLRTRSVNQTGLRLRDPSACLCLSGPGTKDLHHHTWHLFEILNSSFQALLLLSSVISKVLYTQLIHFSLDPSKHFSFSLWPHSCLTD